MDAFFRYNQISLCAPNQEHTSFITDNGLYYYKVMSFSLKNARAAFQKFMNKLVEGMIRDKVEVYIDDLVDKTYA